MAVLGTPLQEMTAITFEKSVTGGSVMKITHAGKQIKVSFGFSSIIQGLNTALPLIDNEKVKIPFETHTIGGKQYIAIILDGQASLFGREELEEEMKSALQVSDLKMEVVPDSVA